MFPFLDRVASLQMIFLLPSIAYKFHDITFWQLSNALYTYVIILKCLLGSGYRFHFENFK